jgi:hypothetical protein
LTFVVRERGREARQPQDHVAAALAGPAQGAQAIEDMALKPDLALPLPSA